MSTPEEDGREEDKCFIFHQQKLNNIEYLNWSENISQTVYYSEQKEEADNSLNSSRSVGSDFSESTAALSSSVILESFPTAI